MSESGNTALCVIAESSYWTLRVIAFFLIAFGAIAGLIAIGFWVPVILNLIINYWPHSGFLTVFGLGVFGFCMWLYSWAEDYRSRC